MRQARRGLRAGQPGLAAGRGRLRARPLPGPRHGGGDPAGDRAAGRHGQGARGHRRDRRPRTTSQALAADGNTAEPQVFVDDRDPLSYLYTSGTTSFPKGVVGTHLAIYLESMSAALDSGWRADDRFVAMMPMFHTAQLNAFCTPAIMVGATIYVLRGFDPAALLGLIERERITQIFGLPMMYRAVLDHDELRRPGPVQPAPGGLRDGPDARRPHPPLPGRVRLRLRAAVRADRDEPDHHAVPARAPALPHRRGRHPADRRAGRDHGPGRRAAAARRDRRDRLPGAEHHVRLPGQRGGHRRGVRARLVPLRRRRPVRRRRRAVVRRPLQGRHQDRRRERRLDRGGEGDLRRRPAGGRGGRGRPAAPALERGDHRRRGAQAGRDDRPGRAARHAQGHAGRVQGAQGGHRRRRAAQDLDRQDPEERPAVRARRSLRADHHEEA